MDIRMAGSIEPEEVMDIEVIVKCLIIKNRMREIVYPSSIKIENSEDEPFQGKIFGSPLTGNLIKK